MSGCVNLQMNVITLADNQKISATVNNSHCGSNQSSREIQSHLFSGVCRSFFFFFSYSEI